MTELRPQSEMQRGVWLGVMAIVVLWAVGYLPNLGLRDLRQEEGRRATPAKEMVASGNYVVPTLYGQSYLNKPPGYFWLVAGVGAVTGGVTAWSDRLPSAVGVLAGALMMLGFARRRLDFKTRWLAAVMLLSCAAMIDKARLGEIDSALSAVVFACLALFWRGQDEAGKKFWSWVWIGVIMGYGVLMKGPGGPLEFYIPVVVYLMWERKWKEFFTVGHLVAVVLMAVPTALWVGAVMARAHMSLREFVYLWADQLGVNNLPGATTVMEENGEDKMTVGRYVTFAWQTATMLLPWVVCAVPLMVPGVARKIGWGEGRERSLWRFLVGSVVGLFVVFFLYPSAHPRHMLVIVYPCCALGAMAIMGLGAKWRTIGAQIAVGVAGVMLVGVAIFYVFFMPKVATKDETARAWAQLEPLVPATGPVYTLLTFHSARGNDYYNLQFHLSPRLRAVDEFAQLPLNRRVPTLMLPADQTLLEAHGCRVEEVKVVTGKHPLAVAEVTRMGN